MKLILASSSPRRRELIETLGVDYDFISPHFIERKPLGFESPMEYVIRMSLLKSLSVTSIVDNDVLIKKLRVFFVPPMLVFLENCIYPLLISN